VHRIGAAGQVVIRRQLKRRYVLAFFEKLPPCLVGIEACASSHHWSRELKATARTEFLRLRPNSGSIRPSRKRRMRLTKPAVPCLSGGAVIKGKSWGRPDDKIGLAYRSSRDASTPSFENNGAIHYFPT
jgi:hypothetical protein